LTRVLNSSSAALIRVPQRSNAVASVAEGQWILSLPFIMSPFDLVVVQPFAFKGLTESTGRELA
jgi:hypothetical protein